MRAMFYRKTTTVSPTLESDGAAYAGLPAIIEITVDSNNNPIVAYYVAASYKIYIKKYNGTEWIDLNFPIAGIPYFADSFAIKVDVNDNLYVAVVKEIVPVVPYYILEVRKYSAGVWSVVGDASPFPTIRMKDDIALDLDNSNNPVVCCTDVNNLLKVARFNGATWDDLNVMSIGVRDYNYQRPVSLKISSNNEIYLALVSSASYLNVIKYNGSSWSYIGQDLSQAKGVCMVLDSNDVPILSTFYNLYTITKYNGATWDAISTQDGTWASSSQSLSLDLNGNITLVYHNSNDNIIYARRYINYTWVDFEGGPIQGTFRDLSSCFDTLGVLLIAHVYFDNNDDAFLGVKKYVPASDSSEWIRIK